MGTPHPRGRALLADRPNSSPSLVGTPAYMSPEQAPGPRGHRKRQSYPRARRRGPHAWSPEIRPILSRDTVSRGLSRANDSVNHRRARKGRPGRDLGQLARETKGGTTCTAPGSIDVRRSVQRTSRPRRFRVGQLVRTVGEARGRRAGLGGDDGGTVSQAGRPTSPGVRAREPRLRARRRGSRRQITGVLRELAGSACSPRGASAARASRGRVMARPRKQCWDTRLDAAVFPPGRDTLGPPRVCARVS